MENSRHIRRIGLIVLILLFLLTTFQQRVFPCLIYKNLLSFLTSEDELAAQQIFDAVYVLGGNQESLKPKFKVLSDLYLLGRCREIVILSRPGSTEFSNALKRNLTNDEWSLMTLEAYGIPAKKVEVFKIQPGFFGTYTEAEFLSRKAEEKCWRSLLLITSPHHTKRVVKSFRKFINDKGPSGLDLRILSSKEKASLIELWVEFFKLEFYQLVLLH